MSLTARIATTDTGRPAVGRGLLVLVDRYEAKYGSGLSSTLRPASGDRPSTRRFNRPHMSCGREHSALTGVGQRLGPGVEKCELSGLVPPTAHTTK